VAAQRHDAQPREVEDLLDAAQGAEHPHRRADRRKRVHQEVDEGGLHALPALAQAPPGVGVGPAKAPTDAAVRSTSR
jgi:hypothetical protein